MTNPKKSVSCRIAVTREVLDKINIIKIKKRLKYANDVIELLLKKE